MTINPSITVLADQGHFSILRVSGLVNIQAIEGSPEGNTAGSQGDLVIDTGSSVIFIKASGQNTTTGWIAVGQATPLDFASYGVRVVGLAVGGTGSVNTSIMLFEDDPDVGDFGVPTSEWLEQTNDAALGTTFRILQPGSYMVTVSGQTTAVTFVGISLDAEGSEVSDAPLMNNESIQAAVATTSPASAGFSCSAPIFVTQEMIDAGQGIIRAHGTSGANLNRPVTGIVIRRMGPVFLPV